MSLLNRAIKAAATAKSQIDDVRELRAQTAVRPVEPARLDEHEQQVLARARAHGAPDPFALLTAAEASEACGTPLGGPHLTYADDSIGVRFEASGKGARHWRVAASAFHGVDDDAPFDAAAYWFGFLADAVAGDGVPVPGLGDVAIRRDREVFVLADPVLLMVEVRTPEPGDDERAVRVARQVLGRLG